MNKKYNFSPEEAQRMYDLYIHTSVDAVFGNDEFWRQAVISELEGISIAENTTMMYSIRCAANEVVKNWFDCGGHIKFQSPEPSIKLFNKVKDN